jgi:hypothetical protein
MKSCCRGKLNPDSKVPENERDDDRFTGSDAVKGISQSAGRDAKQAGETGTAHLLT